VRTRPPEVKTKKPTQFSHKAEFITLSLIVAIAALIGLNYSVMKAALDHTTPLSLAALRTSVGAPFLIAVVLFRKEKFPRKREQWLAIWWISLSITTVSSLFLVIGVSYLSAGVSAMLVSTMPLFTALIAIALLRERPGKLGISGVGVGLVGAVVLAVPALGAGNTTLGVCILLISSITWALGAVLNKKQPAALEISPTMLVAMQIVMSCICLHLVVAFFGGWEQTTWGWGLYWPLLYAGIPSLAVSFVLFATVLRRAPAIQGAAVAYLTPLFGVFFGWVIRGERFGIIEVLGGALVIFGVVAVSFDGRRRL
tara:strand:+ start:5147 stop:6082 length:936 start_codon:yes stop_codon:yes gene_type:complete